MSLNCRNDNYQPNISIIIPLYNVEPFINDCLNSVAEQDYKGYIECVIVDDCGTDNSLELARQFIIDYKGSIDFKIISRTVNGGLSAARNTGLKHATGEYVLFLDSDDELTPSALSSLSEPLKKKQYDFVIGDYIATGTDDVTPQLKLGEGIVATKDIFHNFLIGEWYMMAWNKLCNRQFLINHSLIFKEGIIHEDDLWSFKLAASVSSMFVTKDICYIYKIRSGSITTAKKIENRIKSLLSIYKEFIVFINDKSIDVDTELWNYLQKWVLNILISVHKNKTNYKFSEVYKQLRSEKLSLRNSIFINGKYLKRYIRDFHYIFPIPVSLVYEKLLVAVKSDL